MSSSLDANNNPNNITFISHCLLVKREESCSVPVPSLIAMKVNSTNVVSPGTSTTTQMGFPLTGRLRLPLPLKIPLLVTTTKKKHPTNQVTLCIKVICDSNLFLPSKQALFISQNLGIQKLNFLALTET